MTISVISGTGRKVIEAHRLFSRQTRHAIIEAQVNAFNRTNGTRWGTEASPEPIGESFWKCFSSLTVPRLMHVGSISML